MSEYRDEQEQGEREEEKESEGGGGERGGGGGGEGERGGGERGGGGATASGRGGVEWRGVGTGEIASSERGSEMRGDDREREGHGKGGGEASFGEFVEFETWYGKTDSKKIASRDLTVLRLTRSQTVYPLPSLRYNKRIDSRAFGSSFSLSASGTLNQT